MSEEVQERIDKNVEIQKENSKQSFKMDARNIAIQIASSNKPTISDFSLSQGEQLPTYNLLDEAEKIYNWLIKDL